MKIADLLKDVEKIPTYELERRLNKLVRENYRYSNLDSKNKKLVMELIKKYRTKIKKGIGISSYNIQQEVYRLKQKRLKLDITLEDIKDIKEILAMFKS